jgi:hypothetical protein
LGWMFVLVIFNATSLSGSFACWDCLP